MDFVLNRDKVFATTLGHTIEFKKGKPTHVPFELHSAAQGIGAIPVSEIEEVMLPETNEPADPAVREQLIFDTFEKLVNANKRGDFTATGTPHAKALKEALGFKLDDKERDALWQKFKTKDSE